MALNRFVERRFYYPEASLLVLGEGDEYTTLLLKPDVISDDPDHDSTPANSFVLQTDPSAVAFAAIEQRVDSYRRSDGTLSYVVQKWQQSYVSLYYDPAGGSNAFIRADLLLAQTDALTARALGILAFIHKHPEPSFAQTPAMRALVQAGAALA
jgi:hypothetical protein